MSRVRSILAAALMAASTMGVGTTVAVADGPAYSCASQSWPTGDEAKGIAFVGRVLGSTVNKAGNRVYRFDVLSTRVKPAGSDGLTDPVRVELVGCAATRFRVGYRYLVSSSFGVGHDNRIERVQLSSDHGVAWHAWPDNHVTLMGYGHGTKWDEVPQYLSVPDTLREAVAAIRP